VHKSRSLVALLLSVSVLALSARLAGVPFVSGRAMDVQMRRVTLQAEGTAIATVDASTEVKESKEPLKTIFVCTASSCKDDGATNCLKMLQDLAPEGVEVKTTGCLGPCGSGPNVLASPRLESDVSGGKPTEARKVVRAVGGAVEQPAGYCFTGIKTTEDVALLAPWGFEVEGSQGPLAAIKLAIRNSQLDQVPWPILLYVGFNVVRLVGNFLFHVDILNLLLKAVR